MKAGPAPNPSPAGLALMLAAGLLGLLLLLSLLAPSETAIGPERMEELVSRAMVERVEVIDGRLIGRLRRPVVIEESGHRALTREVILPMPDGAAVVEDLARWRASGVTVALGSGGGRRWLRELAWLAVVGGLLLFGLYNLVQQARRHRREGSPRERIARARKDLEEGRLTRDEYERRVSEIAPEL